MYGRNIFMGYLGDLEKTKEAIDEEGWLRSGDLGKCNKKSLVQITGRIKVRPWFLTVSSVLYMMRLYLTNSSHITPGSADYLGRRERSALAD